MITTNIVAPDPSTKKHKSCRPDAINPKLPGGPQQEIGTSTEAYRQPHHAGAHSDLCQRQAKRVTPKCLDSSGGNSRKGRSEPSTFTAALQVVGRFAVRLQRVDVSFWSVDMVVARKIYHGVFGLAAILRIAGLGSQYAHQSVSFGFLPPSAQKAVSLLPHRF